MTAKAVASAERIIELRLPYGIFTDQPPYLHGLMCIDCACIVSRSIDPIV
jgi:hypothetical protein